MRIAVLGMGRMGRALAGRLLGDDHDLVIWNRTSGKAPELVERGAAEAGTVADAVGGADLAITALADDDAVRAIAFAEDGIRTTLGPVATYADASTVSPGLTEELDDAFPRYVAMPILGSPGQVAEGRASYLIGAGDAAARAVDPLFPRLSQKTFRYYKPSVAAAAKLAVNLLLLDGVIALSESFAVGRAGGLSEEQLRDLLGESPMVAPGLKYRFEGILTRQQETLWTMALGAKDARLAVEVAEASGLELPATSLARDMYTAAASSTNDDIALVAARYRKDAGT